MLGSMLGTMMPALAAASLGLLVQPLQVDEPVPPTEAPAVSAPAPVPPTPTPTTPPEVTEFLGEFTARLYDPRADGLASLSFTLPITDAMVGHTANARVSWVAGSEPTVQVELLDFDLPPMLAQSGMSLDQLRQMVGPQADASGRDFLNRMLGIVFSDIGRGRVGSMGGVVDGHVVVRFGASSSPTDGVKEHQLHIDDDGVLRKHIVIAGGAMGEQRIENNLDWKPAKGGDLLLTKGIAVVMETPMGRLEVQRLGFGYQQVGDMVLLTQLLTEVTMPGMSMPKVTQTISDLIVNGQPVATAELAVPVVAEPAVGSDDGDGPAAEG